MVNQRLRRVKEKLRKGICTMPHCRRPSIGKFRRCYVHRAAELDQQHMDELATAEALVIINRPDMAAKVKYKNNRSGVTGVCFCKKDGTWRARIYTPTGQVSRQFRVFEDAVAWRRAEEAKRKEAT